MSEQTILVNGTHYDVVTGLPINKPTPNRTPVPSTGKTVHPSRHMHKQTQKSHTLNRHVVKKQAPPKSVTRPTHAKSPMITKFAAHPSAPTRQHHLVSDIGPSVHPIVHKAQSRLESSPKQSLSTAVKPAAIIKKEAIAEAMKKAPHHNTAKPVKAGRRTPRMFSLASMALAVLLLAGYFTYINLPNLSVRVAAAQAGIDASYPEYRPDGYRLSGVNYNKGSVSLKFAANAGPQSFVITQQQTAWDSTAVKENYVAPNWGNDVMSYAERGLTIYAHEGNAAWVNGGILYTISGDAPLSSSQVRSIATNL